MALGVEKRVRSMYGEPVEDNNDHKLPFPHLVAYLALLLSFIALVVIVVIYSSTGIGEMRSTLAQTRQQVDALNAQVNALERRDELGQQAVVDFFIADVTGKMRYIAEQPLTPEQRQELRSAFAAADPEMANATAATEPGNATAGQTQDAPAQDTQQ
jgi:hypothetical protein